MLFLLDSSGISTCQITHKLFIGWRCLKRIYLQYLNKSDYIFLEVSLLDFLAIFYRLP